MQNGMTSYMMELPNLSNVWPVVVIGEHSLNPSLHRMPHQNIRELVQGKKSPTGKILTATLHGSKQNQTAKKTKDSF